MKQQIAKYFLHYLKYLLPRGYTYFNNASLFSRKAILFSLKAFGDVSDVPSLEISGEK